MFAKCLSIILLFACAKVSAVNLGINPGATNGVISPYLMGIHTISYRENDAAYEDGSFALWCRDADGRCFPVAMECGFGARLLC